MICVARPSGFALGLEDDHVRTSGLYCNPVACSDMCVASAAPREPTTGCTLSYMREPDVI